jgi:hypothetical protein
MAQPPENVPVKKIFDILADGDFAEIKQDGPAGDILMRRDRAVREALDGMTLKSLAIESQTSAKSQKQIAQSRELRAS